MEGAFYLEELTPSHPVKPKIDDEVAAVSPSFAEIYAQAHIAQETALAQIAGVGYRKAVEFLIKDFCVSEAPEEADTIRAEALGLTISKRISDAQIKEVARRAAWLGNDETHYTRKWEDKDIRDLKVLIELTMNSIKNAMLTKRYIAEMQDTK